MSPKKKKKQTATHADPINELPESFYISSNMRQNFGSGDSTPAFDEQMSRLYGAHLAAAAVEPIGSIRSTSLIPGYIKHQRTITDDQSKFIKIDEVLELSIFERESSNHVLGTKVRIDFKGAPNSKEKNPKSEDIATGWIDYYGYGDTVFEICLARSIAANLAVLRDMDVPFHVRKEIFDTGNNKRGRQLCDVRPFGDAERDAAVIAQNLEALTIAVNDSADEAIEYLHDNDLYYDYYDRAFGVNLSAGD